MKQTFRNRGILPGAWLIITCLMICASVTAVSAQAGIQLYTTPPGANSCLDGWWWQTTPATFDNLDGGYHQVQIYMDGYQPYSQQVYTSEGTEVVNAELIPNSPVSGSLSISSEPDGADVYLDDIYYGNAPQIIGNLWDGTHKLTVRKAGYYDLNDIIPITAGQTYSYNAVLSPYMPVPEFGSLQIDSQPTGAAIFLNGDYKGNTPPDGAYDINELPQGTYSLRLVMQDYQPYIQTVVVTPGIINDIHATLIPVPQPPSPDTTGQILANSAPSGAYIYVDNAYFGMTPLTIGNMAAGSHTVTFRMSGYQDIAQSVQVVAGTMVTVSGTLVPLPQ